MKGIILVVMLITGILGGAMAQKNTNQETKGIQFSETTVWKKIVKKAKREKKMIFIDSYASWCFPCKKLAYKIFTQDSVGDFFNEHFINVKYDMEQDPDGKILKKKYGVRVYPTLLFINPDTEEIEHRMAGAGEAAWLMQGARNAMDVKKNYKAMVARYEAGERSKEFLFDYLKILADAYVPEKLDGVAKQYMETLTTEELVTEEGWKLIDTYLKDPVSHVFEQLVTHKKEFYAFADKEQIVDNKINFLLIQASITFASNYNHKMVFDNERYNALKDCLLKYDSPACPAGLAYLYTIEYVYKQDFKGMLAKMKEVMSYNMFRSNGLSHYIQLFTRTLQKCDDQEILEDALALLQQTEHSSNDNILKIGIFGSMAEIQQKLGDEAGAARSKAERDRLFKDSQKGNK